MVRTAFLVILSLLCLLICVSAVVQPTYEKLVKINRGSNDETFDPFAHASKTMPLTTRGKNEAEIDEADVDEAEVNESEFDEAELDEFLGEFDAATIKKAATPSLSDALLVEILSLLPSGSKFEAMYEKIGSKIGANIYTQLPASAKSQLSTYLHVTSGDTLGAKIGGCFAHNGWLLSAKTNLLEQVVHGVADSKINEESKTTVEGVISQYKIEQRYGLVVANFIRSFAQQFTPYLSSKLMECLIGPSIPVKNGPSNLQLSDVLKTLPQGAAFERSYQFIGYQLGAETGQSIITSYGRNIMTREASTTASWMFQTMGKCIALYGWNLENKSNLLIRLFMKIVNSNSANAFLTKSITSVIKQYHIDSFGPETVSLVQQIGKALGQYGAERFLQCLLLPLSESGRNYKLIPIADLQKTNGVEADLDDAEEQQPEESHHFKHHNNKNNNSHNRRRQRMGQVNVNVHVKA